MICSGRAQVQVREWSRLGEEGRDLVGFFLKKNGSLVVFFLSESTEGVGWLVRKNKLVQSEQSTRPVRTGRFASSVQRIQNR